MKSNPSSEKKQTKRMTQEERAAVEKIVEEQQHLIRHTVQKVLGTERPDLIDDCVQEVFLMICERIDVLLRHENPTGWIVTTSKNIAHNAFRSKQRRDRDEPLDETMPDGPAQDLIEDVVYGDWVKNGVREQLLSELSAREQEVYTLLYIKKYTPKEAAEELHISVSTVRNIHKKPER